MNQKDVRELMRLFDKSGIDKMKIEDGDFSISLQKGCSYQYEPAPMMSAPAPVAAVSQAAPVVQVASEGASESSGEKICSPMVGTFYKSPSPDAAPFVKVGDKIAKGQTLAIIEAMKIMNELEAEFNCKIVDILVEDGQPVEYDMPLFVIERV